ARLTRARHRLGPEGLVALIQRFVREQAPRPELSPAARALPGRDAKRVFDALLEVVAELRHGL
ncbi:MAG TPA: hypothetical protein VJS92_08940, partial [Candidatus Polarisedimenticolaceae bacterium]|nr:hypothetical protein [Candidatus Polarisedimenticolaceae bacterium]